MTGRENTSTARMRYAGLIIVVTIAWLALAPAFGEARASDDEEVACTECHEGMRERFSGAFEHSPFSEDDCYACHVYHGFQPTKALKGRVFDFCTECHSSLLDVPEEEAHDPLTEDDSCLNCHSPHRGTHPRLLRLPANETCLECHDAPEDARGTAHPPYADAECITCHNPHGSLFPAFLRDLPGLVCVECHESLLPGYPPTEMHSAENLDSCGNCHVGHASTNAHLLSREGSQLCAGCHEALAYPDERGFPHDAVTDGECQDCHVPHFEKGASSLVSDQPELCGDCHDVGNEAFAEQHFFPTALNCAGCHDPHGGNVPKFFWAHQHDPFAERECDSCHDRGMSRDDLRSAELCMDCHDEVEDTGAHALSLMGSRTCIDCHSPHASPRAYFLR